jgi:hypothetical protein
MPIQNSRQNFNSIYFNLFCLDRSMAKRFWTKWYQAFPEFNLLVISSRAHFRFVTVPKYLSFATFSKNLLAVFMLWFYSAFWWWHGNIYFVFSVFTSRPTNLLTSSETAYVFLYVIYVFVSKLTSSESELFYDWWFTASPFILATRPLRLTKDFFFLNTCFHSPYVTSSLMREWVCCLQLLLVLASTQLFSAPSPVRLMTSFYCHRSKTSPTWIARSPYLYPPGTGWPSYTPRH